MADGSERVDAGLARAREVLAPRLSDDRPDRRRHLDRLRHPRLPGPAGRVDQEPGGRAHGQPGQLPRGPRRCAGSPGRTGWRRRPGRPSPTPGTWPWSSSSARAGCGPWSPRTSTACTSRPATIPTWSSSCTAPCGGSCAGPAGRRGRWQPALDRVRAGEADPHCEWCGGILKSATISFGQALDPARSAGPRTPPLDCDLLLAVGSTLTVYPAAGLVPLAARRRGGGGHRQRPAHALRRRWPTRWCGTRSATSAGPGRAPRRAAPDGKGSSPAPPRLTSLPGARLPRADRRARGRSGRTGPVGRPAQGHRADRIPAVGHAELGTQAVRALPQSEEQSPQSLLHRPQQQEHGGEGGVDEPVRRRPACPRCQPVGDLVGLGVAVHVDSRAAERNDDHRALSTPG